MPIDVAVDDSVVDDVVKGDHDRRPDRADWRWPRIRDSGGVQLQDPNRRP
jgi:hypothetical protein